MRVLRWFLRWRRRAEGREGPVVVKPENPMHEIYEGKNPKPSESKKFKEENNNAE